jgi:hypothetical protein
VVPDNSEEREQPMATDREVLEEILVRLRQIEEHLGVPKYKSRIGEGLSGSQSDSRPVEPAVSSSPDQPKRLPSGGPRPELLDPGKGKSGGPLKDR